MPRRLTIAVAVPAMLGTAANAQNRDRVLQVMTRNMDTGSDFGFVLGATDQLGVLLGIRATYQEILASDIPERADGIAAEIQTIHPDLVALQEITTLSTGPYGGPATTVVANQLQSLMAALRRRGLQDRKSTRLNSSHSQISYAVFCLKTKNTTSQVAQ